MSKQEIYTKEFTGIFTIAGQQEHMSDQELFTQTLATRFVFETHQHTLDLTCHLIRQGYISNTFEICLPEYMYGYFEEHGINAKNCPADVLINELLILVSKCKANTHSEWVQNRLYDAEQGYEDYEEPEYDSERIPVFFYSMAEVLEPFDIEVADVVKGDVYFGTRWSDNKKVFVLQNPTFVSNIGVEIDGYNLQQN